MGLVLTGCPGTFEGTVGGRSMKVISASFAAGFEGDTSSLPVTLRSSTRSLKNTERLDFRVNTLHVDGEPGAAGNARFSASDDACHFTTVPADEGSVTLTSASESHVAGSFSFRFGDDEVHGTFFAARSAGESTPRNCE